MKINRGVRNWCWKREMCEYWTSVGLVYLLREWGNLNVHQAQQEASEKRGFFSPQRYAVKTVMQPGRLKSCCIQGTKTNSCRWLRSCRIAGVVKKKKIRVKSCTVNCDSLIFLNTDTRAKGSREKNLMPEWSGSLNLKGNEEKWWTPAHLQQHCTQSLPDLGLATVALEALGRQIAQQVCFLSVTYLGVCTACMLNVSGWIWLRL